MQPAAPFVGGWDATGLGPSGRGRRRLLSVRSVVHLGLCGMRGAVPPASTACHQCLTASREHEQTRRNAGPTGDTRSLRGSADGGVGGTPSPLPGPPWSSVPRRARIGLTSPLASGTGTSPSASAAGRPVLWGRLTSCRKVSTRARGFESALLQPGQWAGDRRRTGEQQESPGCLGSLVPGER